MDVRRWLGPSAAALLLLALFALYLGLRPSVAPKAARVSAVLRSPEQGNTLPWMKRYWKLDITVDLRGAAARSPLQLPPGTGLDGFYPYIPNAEFAYLSTGAEGAGGTCDSARDTSGDALFAMALRAHGVLGRGESAGPLMLNQNIWESFAGAKNSLHCRIFVTGRIQPRTGGFVTLVHDQTFLGRDLSWWKSVPITLAASRRKPTLSHAAPPTAMAQVLGLQMTGPASAFAFTTLTRHDLPSWSLDQMFITSSTSQVAILRTSDGGRRWSDVTPASPFSGIQNAFGSALFFLDRAHGRVAVEVQGRGACSMVAIARISDAGSHWQVSTFPTAAQGGVDLAFTTPRDVALSTPGAGQMEKVLYATSDGGRT